MAAMPTTPHVTESDAICKEIWLLCVWRILPQPKFVVFIWSFFTSSGICLYYVGVNDFVA